MTSKPSRHTLRILRTRIVNVLQSNAHLKKIRFTVPLARGKFEINHTRFRRAATLVSNQSVKLMISPKATSAHGGYMAGLNVLEVSRNPAETTIIHEAVHIIEDAYCIRANNLTGEAVAYLTEVIFLVLKNKLNKQPKPNHSQLAPIYKSAFNVALQSGLLYRRGNRLYHKQGVTLDYRKHVVPMRNAVRRSGYSSKLIIGKSFQLGVPNRTCTP